MGYPQICTTCGKSEYSICTNGLCQTCDAEFRAHAPHAGEPGPVLYYEDLPVPEGCVWDAKSGKVVVDGQELLHGPEPSHPDAASEAAFWSTDRRGRRAYVGVKMSGRRVYFRGSRYSSAYQGTSAGPGSKSGKHGGSRTHRRSGKQSRGKDQRQSSSSSHDPSSSTNKDSSS